MCNEIQFMVEKISVHHVSSRNQNQRTSLQALNPLTCQGSSDAKLTLLHSEWPKLHRVLAVLSAIELNLSTCCMFMADSPFSNDTGHLYFGM